ncbi:hypothetical protein B0H19DRAFT_1170996 [Mycena capillaripes]|nr:hypothetical protein B0H19DRAFT_1170996 [Mycena capillaripes]
MSTTYIDTASWAVVRALLFLPTAARQAERVRRECTRTHTCFECLFWWTHMSQSGRKFREKQSEDHVDGLAVVRPMSLAAIIGPGFDKNLSRLSVSSGSSKNLRLDVNILREPILVNRLQDRCLLYHLDCIENPAHVEKHKLLIGSKPPQVFSNTCIVCVGAGSKIFHDLLAFCERCIE